MIIRAKYPLIGNEFVGYQGFGSLYGNNNISDITSGISGDRTVEQDHDSVWPDNN